jgi:hypothetical protein
MGPSALPPEAVSNLEGLAQRLSLPGHDLLLVGDGPCNTSTQPAGWACVTYDRLKGRATAHAGAATCGTNNFAEPAPTPRRCGPTTRATAAPRPRRSRWRSSATAS